MNKPVEEMTDHEILVELLEEKRFQERTRNIRIGFRVAVALVVVVLLCIYLPPVIRFYRQMNDTMQQVRDAVEQVKGASSRVQGTMDELQGTVDSIKDSLANLKQNGVDVLQGAMDQLNQLLEGFPRFW